MNNFDAKVWHINYSIKTRRDIDSILDKAEKGALGFDDVVCELEKMNVEVLERTQDDSGYVDDVEITDCEEVRANEE